MSNRHPPHMHRRHIQCHTYSHNETYTNTHNHSTERGDCPWPMMNANASGPQRSQISLDLPCVFVGCFRARNLPVDFRYASGIGINRNMAMADLMDPWRTKTSWICEWIQWRMKAPWTCKWTQGVSKHRGAANGHKGVSRLCGPANGPMAYQGTVDLRMNPWRVKAPWTCEAPVKNVNPNTFAFVQVMFLLVFAHVGVSVFAPLSSSGNSSG